MSNTTKPQFTPGPWRVTEPCCNGYVHKYIQAYNGLFVAITNKDDFLKGQIEANSRLIAQAPAMYDLLQDVLWHEANNNNDDYCVSMLFDKIRATLATIHEEG